jgi:hypothetical protein
MFFQVQWKTAQTTERKSRRVPTPYGTADLWTESTGTAGVLAVLFKFEGPRVHTAPGLLLSISEWFQSLSGTEAVLRLTPIPKEWRGAPVGPFFEQAGFEIRLSEYTIELHSDMPPGDAIEKAALIFFALDLFRGRPEWR